MQVLVATRQTQGSRPDDFDGCLDGELVWAQSLCDAAKRGDPDDCGCTRAFVGMASHAQTTTAEVRALDMTTNAYRAAVEASSADQGWIGAVPDLLSDHLLRFAAMWPVGTVIERDRLEFGPRVLVE